ncbi:hypothetical protein B566_EDAN009607 [Ephemera danica]|nr:hypothetical protein B566_EDAN009607 [Ephemera danica]
MDGSISESITQCSDMGMTLASLETTEEILAVTNYIRDELSLATRMYWLSGQRVVNTWMWMSSGQFITVNNWDTSEPTETGYTNQACVFLYNAKFRDNNCNSNIHFICEQKDCP